MKYKLPKASKGKWETQTGLETKKLFSPYTAYNEGSLTKEEFSKFMREWRITPEGKQYVDKNFRQVFGPANSVLGTYDPSTQSFFKYDDKEAARAHANAGDTELNASNEQLKNYLKQQGLMTSTLFKEGGEIPMFKPGGTTEQTYDIAKRMEEAANLSTNSPKQSFSQFYREALKNGKAGDVVEYNGKKILLDPRDFNKPSFSPNKRPSFKDAETDYVNSQNAGRIQYDAGADFRNRSQNVRNLPQYSSRPAPAQQSGNGPLSGIVNGIDWLNDHTGDNPIGGATRFIMNAVKAPFEGGRNLSYDIQPDEQGNTNLGAHSVLDAVNAFSPAVGKGLGYLGSKAAPLLKGFPAISSMSPKAIQRAATQGYNQEAISQAQTLFRQLNMNKLAQLNLGIEGEAAVKAATKAAKLKKALPKKIPSMGFKKGGSVKVPMFDL